MKVVMKSYMTGKNFEHQPGDIVDFDDAEAERVISVGGARALTEAEAASVQPEPKKPSKA